MIKFTTATQKQSNAFEHGVRQAIMQLNQSIGIGTTIAKSARRGNRGLNGRQLASAVLAALVFCVLSCGGFLNSAHCQTLSGPLSDKAFQKAAPPEVAQNPTRLTASLPPSLRSGNLARGAELPTPVRLKSTMASRIGSAGEEAFTEPIETIKIAAAETGIIGKVVVKRGDTVTADDLLFELDMTVLEASKRLALAKASSKARLRAAEVEFNAKTKSYHKRVKLLEDQAGSPEEVEKAKTEVDLAQQNIEAIVEEQEQASLETKRIETQMEQRRTRSPIDGVVIDVRRKPGEYVSNADPHIATVVQLETLRVVFYLPTGRAASIKSGDVVNLLLPETNQRTEGTVEYVAPITNADSGRVRVEVLVDNESGDFRSGVRCRILESSSTRQSKRTTAGKTERNRR